ncbi:MAG: DUF3592 domain-containing protein, partial [Anaerolineales bacterium]|nr:DUF3592 domain-containing protein [Anaerolineales bacterium]
IVRQEPEGPVFLCYWRDWGFLYFALVGLGFLGFVIWIIVTNPWEYSSEGQRFMLLPLVFGLGLAYWSLGQVINRTEIHLQHSRLVARHKPLPWRHNANLLLADIEEICWTGAWLVANTRTGKSIVLVPKMESPAGQFLEQEIKACLGLRPALPPVEQTMAVQFSRKEARRQDAREGKGAVMIMTVLFFVLAILGAWLLISTYQGQREAQASLTWPSTRGLVSDLRIETNVQENDNGPDTFTYEPVVVYSYKVNGETYTSDRLSANAPWGYAFGSQEEAAEFLRNYPLGTQLVVYYNPDHPRRALLDRTAPADPGIVYILGWGLVGLAPLALFIMILWAWSLCRAEGRPGDWKRLSFWQAQFRIKGNSF